MIYQRIHKTGKKFQLFSINLLTSKPLWGLRLCHNEKKEGNYHVKAQRNQKDQDDLVGYRPGDDTIPQLKAIQYPISPRDTFDSFVG